MILNQLMPNGTRNYLIDLFKSHELPSFCDKADSRTKMHIYYGKEFII